MDPQYTVLARRFRPQTFAEVVGQERVAQTLRNAIKDGRVAHAYLFTGARGVGKTSMARIFSKALNCPDAKDGVPCNECEQCRGISVGQDVDVSEIDGASNRGIDDIRSLRANVSIKSMRSRYKIYIIDEVHMLTKEAFNALLKTLEEPPPMVKFIFCTTEPNKVPDTILSRCQRFDFGTISIDNITIRLRQLAEAEGFQVDEAALELVARRAAGSMRDSQSLFDQLLAFGSEHITSADVHRLLGTAPDDRLTGLVDSLIEGRRDDALLRLDTALREGVQLEAFTDQFVGYFRDLMVTASGADDVPLLAVGMDSRETLRRQAGQLGLQTIVNAMQILAEAKSRMQRVSFGRALAELALVRISLFQDLDCLDDLISQLKGGTIGSGSGGGSTSGGGAGTGGTRSGESTASGLTAPIISRPPSNQTVQKKNDLIERVSEPLMPESSAILPIPTIESLPEIQWKDGCGKDLQSAIANRLNDMTGIFVSRAQVVAIIGPNMLDFSLPMNYDLERMGLERPEIVAKLEAIASELVGRSIRIQIRMTETVDSSTKIVPPTVAGNRIQVIENPEDPYLQDITKTFGVKYWLVKELVVESTEDDPS